jgi:hypothetical protein
MTPNEQKAAELTRNFFHSNLGVTAWFAAEVVPLLRTELDDRARELKDAMVAYHSHVCPSVKEFILLESGPHRARVMAALQAILAAEKPVERWTVRLGHGLNKLFVYDGGEPTDKSFPPDAEPEARAYVARKNAEGK